MNSSKKTSGSHGSTVNHAYLQPSRSIVYCQMLTQHRIEKPMNIPHIKHCGTRISQHVVLTMLLTALLSLGSQMSLASFMTFESGQVRPLALSPDETLLFAINTPDNRIEVFSVDDEGISYRHSIPVGMEPVAVAARTNTEIWVTNHLSDSVSIIDLNSTPPRVIRTLLLGDEPRDIVFGGLDKRRAFITTAHRGQHRTHPSIASVPGAGDPQLTTPSIPRADVWVFDALNLGETIGGTPLKIIELFGDTPRALAVNPDGSTVYAAVFHSGNQTATVTDTAVCDTNDTNIANNIVEGPCLVSGIPMPGGMPLPHHNANGDRRPETGLVVKFDNTASAWLDELDRNWNNAIRFHLPDLDVFAIDTTTLEETASFAHVGTILFNMLVNPINEKVYVSMSDAHNEVRFEGSGAFVQAVGAKPDEEPTSVQGHLHEMGITILDRTQVLPRHLNKHINYDVRPASPEVKQHSLSTPLGMAISRDGTTLYVAAFGSSTIGVFDTAELETDTFDPTTTSANYIKVSGGGPSGVVLDETRQRLYVLTRFDNSISVIDLTTRNETAHIGMFNPEPLHVINGRRFLYDAPLSSSNGEASCASCHIFADFDSLTWDLGNPDGHVVNNPIEIKRQGPPELFPNINGTGNVPELHPMKGPMTTQTMRGMANNGSMHWRGDRTGGNDPGGDVDDEFAAFIKFIGAFEGLMGNDPATPFRGNDMAAFAKFSLDIVLPPNPVRPLNNTLTPSQQTGRDFYIKPTNPGFSCKECHSLDRPFGQFGADGTVGFKNEPQIVKIPHLRNMYQKVGMFGMPQTPFFDATTMDHQGDQVRGSGFFHDGSIDTLFRLNEATVFSELRRAAFNTDQERREVEKFLLAFDTDLAPIVGQQVTLTSTNPATVGPRIDLLIERAQTDFILLNHQRPTECDLIVKGTINGKARGWVMNNSTGMFTSDRADEPPLTDIELREFSAQQGQELTYTCVPPGSGWRMGVDRNNDGISDGSERADLTVVFTTVKRKVQSSGDKLVMKFTVKNIGEETARGPFPISVFLSDDNTLDTQDQLLETFTIKRIKQNKQKSRVLKRKGFPPLNGKYVLVVIDSPGVIQNRNRNSNIVAHQIPR